MANSNRHLIHICLTYTTALELEVLRRAVVGRDGVGADERVPAVRDEGVARVRADGERLRGLRRPLDARRLEAPFQGMLLNDNASSTRVERGRENLP